MITRLTELHPQEARARGESELNRLVRDGTESAEQYDIEYEDDVKRYLDLMLVFGTGFSTAPEYQWAQQILEQLERPADERLDLIFRELADSHKDFSGPN